MYTYILFHDVMVMSLTLEAVYVGLSLVSRGINGVLLTNDTLSSVLRVSLALVLIQVDLHHSFVSFSLTHQG